MNIEVIKSEKGHSEILLDSVTIAEVLRVYLAENGASFAAWRREHPSKPTLLRIDSDAGVPKAVKNAVSAIKKDCDKFRALVKK